MRIIKLIFKKILPLFVKTQKIGSVSNFIFVHKVNFTKLQKKLFSVSFCLIYKQNNLIKRLCFDYFIKVPKVIFKLIWAPRTSFLHNLTIIVK